jgi:hypothetical protein
MTKHKYLSYFDYFSLWSNALYGSLDCDYTLLKVNTNLDPKLTKDAEFFWKNIRPIKLLKKFGSHIVEHKIELNTSISLAHQTMY